MGLVIGPPVAQIDPPNERDVLAGAPVTLDQDKFLVMRSESAHPLVQKDLPTPVIYRLRKLSVLLFAELLLIGV